MLWCVSLYACLRACSPCQGSRNDCTSMQIEAEVMRVMAEEGRLDLLARWMGILIRGGHER